MTLPQNQKLEELFDLPSSKDEDETVTEPSSTENSLSIMPEALAAIDKIEAALPAVRGLETSDQELDELAKLATESFQDLSNLGMQVDSRYSSEIFAVASQMLGHAITAKTAKMNKKLKMIDLQMRKLKLDREGGQDAPGLPTAQGHVMDRNELLRHVLNTTGAAQTTESTKYTKES